MSGQASFKVTGPWRMLVRRDNQDVRVVNANEDYTVLFNDGAISANLSIVMMSTEMPLQTPSGSDETKAFAPDPHEPEKTEEQRNTTFDPLVREREERERLAASRGEASLSASEVQLGQGSQAFRQASGESQQISSANVDGAGPGTDLSEAEAEEQRKAKEAEEASRDAGAKEAERKEKERADKDAERKKQENLDAQAEAAGKSKSKK